MRLGIPKESTTGERRVALVPETIGRLGEGVDVVVESGAGHAASFSDDGVHRRRRVDRRSVVGRGGREGRAADAPRRRLASATVRC